MEAFSRHERVKLGKPGDHLELSIVGSMNDNRKNLYRISAEKMRANC